MPKANQRYIRHRDMMPTSGTGREHNQRSCFCWLLLDFARYLLRCDTRRMPQTLAMHQKKYQHLSSTIQKACGLNVQALVALATYAAFYFLNAEFRFAVCIADHVIRSPRGLSILRKSKTSLILVCISRPTPFCYPQGHSSLLECL